MRLYDILRSVDPSFPQCNAFIADAIAERIDSGADAPDFENWPADAYGNVAPPFKEFFVETRGTISLAEFAESLGLPPGAQFMVEGLGDEVVIERGVLVVDMTSDPRIERLEHLDTGFPLPEGTKWVLACYGFLRMAGGDIGLFPGHLFLHIGADGRLLDDTSGVHMVEYPDSMLLPGVDYYQLAHLATFVPFMLFAVKALHDRCQVEHVKPSRQQRRYALRKQQINLQEHYILKVTTPVPQRRYPDRPKQDEKRPPKRSHGVRGHFRFYTQEKPLFGRIAGAVWVPAHQRGKREAGTIGKDYLIQAKETGAEP